MARSLGRRAFSSNRTLSAQLSAFSRPAVTTALTAFVTMSRVKQGIHPQPPLPRITLVLDQALKH